MKDLVEVSNHEAMHLLIVAAVVLVLEVGPPHLVRDHGKGCQHGADDRDRSGVGVQECSQSAHDGGLAGQRSAIMATTASDAGSMTPKCSILPSARRRGDPVIWTHRSR